jgi:aerobic carbon-monoxide dehydrogenase medium subunit
MKPARFVYVSATSVDEALALLEEHGDEARVLAGGQSLVPLMNFRLARPSALVDLGRVSELRYISRENGSLRIGAMTRQRELERDPSVAEACPLFRRATELIGHVQIRNRGTIGGSLAHADPSAEYPAAALALGAELVVRAAAGERVVPAADFFLGPFTTALELGELLVEVRLPTWATHADFQEVARRNGDFAIAAVAVGLEIRNGRIERAGIGLAGVGPSALKATSAESLLIGNEPSDDLFRHAAAEAAAPTSPGGDIHGSAEYRKSVVETLAFRGLRNAAGSEAGST